MSRIAFYVVYVVTAVIGLATAYLILTAGSPDSLTRSVLPDPDHDLYAAMVGSGLVFVLGFVIFYSRDREGFRGLVEMNAAHIRELRTQGHTDDRIADSILTAMGSFSGYRHNMARKKLIIYLSQFR